MFVTHDKSVIKKKIQKPNILRRKPKTIAVVKSSEVLEPLLEYQSDKFEVLPENPVSDDEKTFSKSLIKSMSASKKPYQIVNEDSLLRDCQIIECDANSKSNSLLPTTISLEISNSNEDDFEQSSLNIDSFLIETSGQDFPFTSTLNQVKCDPVSQIIKTNDKLCFGFIDDSNRLIIEECGKTEEDFYLNQKSDVISTMVPLSAVSTLQDSNDHVQIQTLKGYNMFSIEDLTQKSVRYKCDEPNCTKEFLNEQKLLKHKNTHNKEYRGPRQTTLECPVKKLDASDMEIPCGRIFQVRGDLIKHLNEDHTSDDAVYKCDECDRRFFWASGLRAHSRSHALGRARTALACPWPGCGRVFRQPCRLREHSRAHTGDKPYHCRHPNCGWSFRTASKLLRHSRRHTGDRRHACAACGRAFLRREHLREHAARHHAPARAPHACPHHDCQQSFTNMSTLYTHIKKIHRKEDINDVDDPVPEDDQGLKKNTNMFMVNLWDGSSTLELIEENKDTTQDICIESKGDVGIELQLEDATDIVDLEGVTPVEGIMEVVEQMEMEGEGHSARTHCTWPLTQKVYKDASDGYVLEDDVQVEQSEGSESNIYTVRSDLFLHGSVFHNEDSEQMCGERLALDADLLLDAPAQDLAPEEFYTDAVDESSFRVFLLSGEELT